MSDGDDAVLPLEVLESLPQGLSLWDPQRRLRAWNGRFLEFTGLPPAAVRRGRDAGAMARDLAEAQGYAGAGVDEYVRGFLRAFDRQAVHACEETTLDGRVMQVRHAPLSDGGALRSYSDITERRRAEMALVQSELRYRRVVDSQTELVCRFEPDGALDFVNEAFARYLGRRRSDLLGRSVFAVFPPDDAAALRGAVERAGAGGPGGPGEGGAGVVATRLQPAAGGDAWQEWTLQAIHEAGGAEFQLVGRDVTALRTAERQSVQLAKVASLGHVVAGMAHELNQPLNTIAMAAENTLMGLDQGRLDKGYLTGKLQTVYDNAMRMGEIMGHLRAFNRPATGEVRLERLGGVVQRGIRLAARQLEIDGIALDCRIAEADIRVRCNAVALEQVVLNLLTNARDAIVERRSREPSAPARVAVEVFAPAPGRAVVLVRDSGGGIPAHVREHIFDPLFTTKTAVGRDGGHGLGLGLSICYRSLARMGASIAATNVGEGAEVRVELPAGEDASGCG